MICTNTQQYLQIKINQQTNKIICLINTLQLISVEKRKCAFLSIKLDLFILLINIQTNNIFQLKLMYSKHMEDTHTNKKSTQNPSPKDLFKAVVKLHEEMSNKNIITLIQKLFWRQYNPNQVEEDIPTAGDIVPKQPMKKVIPGVKSQNLKIQFEDADPLKNIKDSMSIMRVFRASSDLRDIQRIVQLPRMHNGWDKNDPDEVKKNKGEYQRRFELCTAVIKSFQVNGFGSRAVRKFTTKKMDCYIYQTMLQMSSRVFFRMLQKYMMIYADPKLKYTPHSQYALMSCLLFSKKDYFSSQKLKQTFIKLLKLTFQIQQVNDIKKQEVIDLYQFLIMKLKDKKSQVAVKNEETRILVKQEKIKLEKKHLIKFQADGELIKKPKPQFQRDQNGLIIRKKKKAKPKPKKTGSTPAQAPAPVVVKKQKVKQQQPKKTKKIQKKKKKPKNKDNEDNYYDDDYFDSDEEIQV